MSKHRIEFRVNDRDYDLEVSAERRLIDVLRDDCEMTGTKEGCGVGVCGACSVLLDGTLVSACLIPAVFADHGAITTVEGLADGNGELSKLQLAFIRHGGFQCGICTPGQLMAATALLAERPAPTDAEISSWMIGNLCRCTGYYGIARAIRAAAERP